MLIADSASQRNARGQRGPTFWDRGATYIIGVGKRI